MKVINVTNYNEMSHKAASMIANQIILKPNSVLGLATGETPIGMYRELVKLYQKGKIDFAEVSSFNLDEYYGIQRENEQSYYYYMIHHFFQFINMKQENIHLPNGMVVDIEEECRKYEMGIKELGGIDLQVLGIGVNGHIGFNEPNTNFEAETHLVELAQKTIESNSRFFDSIEEVPTKAISMGIKTILQSKKIVVLASGKNKAEAVARMVSGKISPELPASILQLHSDVTVIVDEEAGSRL